MPTVHSPPPPDRPFSATKANESHAFSNHFLLLPLDPQNGVSDSQREQLRRDGLLCGFLSWAMSLTRGQVVRYTALLSGIAYGLVHQGTLQKTHDEEKVRKAGKDPRGMP